MRSDAYLGRVGWGSYKQYSGPIFRGGGVRLVVSPEDTFWRKALGTCVATESGGYFNAVNMYDRCVVSVGLIQWCEANGAVSKLLGKCAERDVVLLREYLKEIPAKHVDFSYAPKKGWKFWLDDVDPITNDEQRRKFFLGTPSLGSWTEEKKAYAKRTCAVMASIWDEEVFREAQCAFTEENLQGWIPLGVLDSLFPEGFPEDSWDGAMRAAYVSFAINLPGVAYNQWKLLQGTALWVNDTPRDRCIKLIKQLTFGPGIAIYPARYNAIRPVLERLFGVDLPDFADELAKWKDEFSLGGEFDLSTVKGLQRALIHLGYDLGPRKDDGICGVKTRVSIRQFQEDHGIPTTVLGLVDLATAKAIENAVEQEG